MFASSFWLLIRTHNRARCQAEIPLIAPSEIVEPSLIDKRMVLGSEQNRILRWASELELWGPLFRVGHPVASDHAEISSSNMIGENGGDKALNAACRALVADSPRSLHSPEPARSLSLALQLGVVVVPPLPHLVGSVCHAPGTDAAG